MFDTAVKAKTIKTPVGFLRAPLHPLFASKLARCERNEDLFALVSVGGLIDPDAFNEVRARGLYGQYVQWRDREWRASQGGQEYGDLAPDSDLVAEWAERNAERQAR